MPHTTAPAMPCLQIRSAGVRRWIEAKQHGSAMAKSSVVPKVSPNTNQRVTCQGVTYLHAGKVALSASSGSRLIAGQFSDRLDSFECAEHVPPVATLPQEPAEWAPYLGEEVVAEVE